MVDENLKPWLIEVNTNPSLETCCPLLAKIMTQLLDHSLALSVDPVFPPPCHFPNTVKHLAPSFTAQSLAFELVVEENEGEAVPCSQIYD
jgi:hypothetical protein